MSSLHVTAVVLAAGRSTRMEAGDRKPFLELAGRTILERACAACIAAPAVERLVVVVSEEDLERAREILDAAPFAHEVHDVVCGGPERTDSVRLGVAAAPEECDVILVHDAARPLVLPERVQAIAMAAADRGAAIPAVPVMDTIKTSRDGKEITGTLDRSLLWAAQTPQGFDAVRLRAVLARARRDQFHPTDDAGLFERYEGAVELVPSDPSNLKLTTAEDLLLGEAILRAREGTDG